MRVGFFRYVGALRRVAISGVFIVSADLGGNLFDGYVVLECPLLMSCQEVTG